MEKGITGVYRSVEYLVCVFDKGSSLGVPAHLPFGFALKIRGELQGEMGFLLEGSPSFLSFLISEF